MKYPELAGLRFSKSTDEQFKEFFEANEMSISSDFQLMFYSLRKLKSGKLLIIRGDGELSIEDNLNACELKIYTTFGEALEAANKIAEILGGWAE